MYKNQQKYSGDNNDDILQGISTPMRRRGEKKKRIFMTDTSHFSRMIINNHELFYTND